MTIVEFIEARLREDEELARAAMANRYIAPPTEATLYVLPPDTPLERHKMHHDPARVLAQVAAMRAIVDLLTSRERQDDSEEGLWHKIGYDRAAFDVLRHLAAIWRDHDDYDPAWSPDA